MRPTRKPAFAAWAEVVQQIGPVRPEDKREFAQLMKLLTEPRSESKVTKYVLFNEVIAFLRLAASVRPILIVLEDLQWADDGTWDMLEHVMGQLDFDRILICATMRTEDTRGEALERRNRLLRDERFREISLPRLTEPQVRQWVTSVFGGEASRELMAYLLRYSEGNPLLATQLLRTLLEDHAVRYEHGRWGLRSERDHALPAVLTGIMERRLDRLSPNTRKILNTAAVIGRSVRHRRRHGGRRRLGRRSTRCDRRVHPARGHRAVADTSGTHFSFTHRLLVDAVHRAINPRRLARIHERVAEAMETHTPDNAAEIAMHYDRSGSTSKAFPHAMRAGGSALLVYAHAEARQILRDC